MLGFDFFPTGSHMDYDNIILIGMAAAGKSTLGRRLAKRLDWGLLVSELFMD